MIKQDLTIGIITEQDPKDKRSWSGVFYHMNKTLENEFSSVICLGPVKLGKWSKYIIKWKVYMYFLFHKAFFGKDYNRIHNHVKSKYYGKYFEKKLKTNKVDVIFAPVASNEIAHLKTDIPICYFSDATFALLRNYYDVFRDLSLKSQKESNEIEQRAINNSSSQIYSSKWAFNSAVSDYSAKNPFIIKLGTNIEEEPTKEELLKQYDGVINILFVGIDWIRKGGDIVLETLEILDNKGYNVHLTVVGCTPPRNHPKMEVIPFLNKNKAEEKLRFQNLYKKSHLFFMPSRAETFGMAFCEANAYGLPVIAADTGGVSSAIEDGVNGFLLPLKAKGEEYSIIIENLISDKKTFKKISETSRQKYEKELNWRRWGKEMKKILVNTSKVNIDTYRLIDKH